MNYKLLFLVKVCTIALCIYVVQHAFSVKPCKFQELPRLEPTYFATCNEIVRRDKPVFVLKKQTKKKQIVAKSGKKIEQRKYSQKYYKN